MCLDMRYDKETEKKMIAKLPDEFVVYKVVRFAGGVFLSCYDSTGWTANNNLRYEYSAGGNRAKHISVDVYRHSLSTPIYKAGFHSFKTRKGAARFRSRKGHGKIIVKAWVKRSWVTAIGKQIDCRVIVSKKIIMPSPKDKSAVVGN